MKIEKIDRNRFAVNTYIVYDENSKNAVIIDPAVNYDSIVDFIDKNDIKPHAILLTHGHIDHIADVSRIREKYNIKVYIHQLGEKMLVTPEYNLSLNFGYVDFNLEADNFFKDKDILEFEELKFEVMHTPGHSIDCSTFIIDNILFTGDTLFRGSMGRVDLPGSNPEHMRESLFKLSKFGNEYIIHPGHSGSTNMLNEKAMNPYLKSL